MAWCLSPEAVRKFKLGLKDKKIDPARLMNMTSAERRAFFTKYVGEENASQVNSLFESKLLLKNQKAGMISWARKVAGMTPEVKRDMITRIARLDKVLSPTEENTFLQDLASSRLRLDVTSKEAKQIYDLFQTASKSKESWIKQLDKHPEWSSDPVATRKEWMDNTTRLQFGTDQVALENYVNDLKIKSEKLSFRENPFKWTAQKISYIPGVLKSIVASYDNSFWGRQGIKTLLDVRTSHIWLRNFRKSWKDMGRQLVSKGKIWKSGDDAVMDTIKADLYSRPNAMNGKYERGDYGIHVFSEEAYPSALPSKIPLFGRLYKASEVAYNGGALRMRADLADRIIAMAEKNEVNTLDKTEARGLGQLVSSLTGRGSNYLRATGEQQKALNVLVFSIKLLEGNIDTITAHQFDPKATEFTKKEARKSLISIVGTLVTILTLVNLIDPDAVDEDPRSTNFGRIKVFGHWVDLSGGMASLVTLASRLSPTWHNGRLSWWYKSSTGNWTDLASGKYGQNTAWDILVGFMEGKASPISRIFMDVLKHKDFQGNPVTYKTLLKNAGVPLSIQNFAQIKTDPASSFILGSMIFEGLGFSTSTYRYKANWEISTSEEMRQFKEEVGIDEFKRANDDFNRAYTEWYNKIIETPEYRGLSDEGKAKVVTNAKSAFKEQIFEEYGFKHKKAEKTEAEEEESETIKELKPE